ncbi:MAG: DUF6810 family protein [Chloroflexota bacterium]|nr:DUF6810 family protein [Chloroflexota bacterium]
MLRIYITTLIITLILISCSSAEGESNSESLDVVTNSEKIFSMEDFYSVGFKDNRSYDVSELPGASDAVFGFWGKTKSESKTYEIRIYNSHEDAVSLGESFAKEVTGNDAIIKSSASSWKEGIKDRRKIGGPGSSGGGRSGTFPRYGNYAIYGNVVMLCEGTEEIALEICWNLIEEISN